MSEPNSVERATRRVIERKLLMALEEGGLVAILASKQDLEDMIAALEYGMTEGNRDEEKRFKNLSDGFKQLLKEAWN